MDVRPHRPKLAAALLTLALGTGAAAATAGTGFRDPVGDVRGGAGPDLASIAVSHSASTVTFRFRFATAPPLRSSAAQGWIDVLLVGIDVPPRGLKRGPRGWTGADYYVGLHGTQRAGILVRAATPPSGPGTVLARPKIAVVGRTVTFSVGRRALGDPAWIAFAVAAGRETSDQGGGGGEDEAPARGTFRYRLG